jgi:multidrug efflux pump subunit AcrB
LSPALCAALLKPHHAHAEPRGIKRILRGTFGRFNAAFEWLSSRYSNMTSRFVRASALILVVYVGLISLTGFQFARMPTALIPDQDIGYQAIVVMLPPGSSLERTDAVVRESGRHRFEDTRRRAYLSSERVRRDDRNRRTQRGDDLHLPAVAVR